MKADEIFRELRRADPASPERMAWLELGSAEAALAQEVIIEPAGEGGEKLLKMPRPQPRRMLGLVGLGVLAASAAAAVLLLGGSSSESPPRAYGAELVRFAESTPLLLLEASGWRVQDVHEQEDGLDSMEFVTGKPVAIESIRRSSGNAKTGDRESGMAPAPVRQRKVELRWSHGSLKEALANAHRRFHSHGGHWVKTSVLGTTAEVDTRDEIFVNQGGPNDRTMTAYWSEDGYLLELQAAVPSLAAFEDRLGSLARVDSKTWLDAMPETVIKAADHGAAVREMLRGIPLPSDFTPAMLPDPSLTTNRGQVRSAVSNTVSCLWFRQWGEARRAGERGTQLEAEHAMGSVKHWPVIRQIEAEGGYPETVLKLVASMPSGVYQFGPRRYPLLPKAEGLGCAGYGVPVLPRTQRHRGERAEESKG